MIVEIIRPFSINWVRIFSVPPAAYNTASVYHGFTVYLIHRSHITYAVELDLPSLKHHVVVSPIPTCQAPFTPSDNEQQADPSP